MKQDKRYIKTEKVIRTEFLSLLKNNLYDDITIEKLCENAVISKNTFYAHYKNVHQLFEEIIDSFMEDICGYVAILNDNIPKEKKFAAYMKLIKYIDKNSRLFIMIFENTNNFEIVGNQYQLLQQKLHQRIKSNNNMLFKYITNYYIYSGGAILYTWLKNDKKESYEEIAKILYAFVNKGVSYFIANQ